MPSFPLLPPLPRAARLVAIACCAGLVLLYSAHSLLLVESAPNPLLWAVLALPLAAFLPGLMRGDARACQWLSFLVLAYFINGVLAVFTPGQQIKGALEILFCVGLFASAIVFVHGCGKAKNAGKPLNSSRRKR